MKWIHIIWGEAPEAGTRPKTYMFNTEEEAAAFRLGVKEMSGWFDYTEVDGPNFVVDDDGEVAPSDADGNPIKDDED